MNRLAEAAATMTNRGDKKAFEPNAISRPMNAFLTAGFAIYAVLCILPVLLVVMVSLTDEQSVADHGYNLFPAKWSVKAYSFLFENSTQILHAYGSTIAATVIGTVVGLFITACFAYAISRKDFKYRNVFAFYAFFTMLFNGGLVPWYMVYAKYLSVEHSLLALILPNLLMNAFYILMVRTFFMTSIPPEIYESAQIDGAGELRVFLRIVLPLSLPVFATVALFYTLQYWNDWFNSMIFNTVRYMSLQYLMQRTLLNVQYLLNNSTAATQANLAFPGETVRMAMAVIGIGPIVFAYPFFQKYFVKGLTIGAVKG